MTSTAEVLLKLLDKVPNAGTLEILLEPENLLILLEHYGRSKDDIRQALKNGTLPGELLLELLAQEPNSDRLLAQLYEQGKVNFNDPVFSLPKTFSQASSTPPLKTNIFESAPPPEEKAKNTPATGGTLFERYSLTAAVVIISLTSILPALIVAGFMPPLKIAPEIATIIALIGGVVAAAVSSSVPLESWKRAVVGMVYSVTTLWATILYTQVRPSFFNIELAIPMGLGAIPALIVYAVLHKLTEKP